MSHIANLQTVMKKNSVEAILISSELNQRYLSGFNYTDGYMLILQNQAFLLADFRYIEAAKEAVDQTECQVIRPDRAMLKYVAALLTSTVYFLRFLVWVLLLFGRNRRD